MARNDTLKSLRDFAAVGRDFSYIARSIVVIKDKLVKPAIETVANVVEEVSNKRTAISDNDIKQMELRRRIEAMDDEDPNKAQLLELLD